MTAMPPHVLTGRTSTPSSRCACRCPTTRGRAHGPRCGCSCWSSPLPHRRSAHPGRRFGRLRPRRARRPDCDVPMPSQAGRLARCRVHPRTSADVAGCYSAATASGFDRAPRRRRPCRGHRRPDALHERAPRRQRQRGARPQPDGTASARRLVRPGSATPTSTTPIRRSASSLPRGSARSSCCCCRGRRGRDLRGRRFGPLVAERLPVSVRASKTTEGRDACTPVPRRAARRRSAADPRPRAHWARSRPRRRGHGAEIAIPQPSATD